MVSWRSDCTTLYKHYNTPDTMLSYLSFYNIKYFRFLIYWGGGGGGGGDVNTLFEIAKIM